MRTLLTILEHLQYKSKNVWGVGLSGYKFFQSKNKKKYLGENKVLVVFVSKKKPAIQLQSSEVLPQSFYYNGEELVVDVFEATPPKIDCFKCDIFCSTRSKYDPIQPGVSLAAINSTACTFTIGAKREGKPVGLTNAHCTSLLKTGKKDEILGELIVQPASFDGGTKEDAVGQVVDLTDISKHVLYTDTAVFTLNRAYNPQMACSKISILDKYKDPVSTMTVYKSGRTTGCNMAKIIATNACINVQYGDQIKTFCDIFITTPFSKPGDSGSPVVEKNGTWLGQLFAGSSSITAVIKARNIIREFNLSL